MGVRKVSNSKGDLQGHSRALAVVSFDRPHIYDFLLVFYCNYVSILQRFRDIIAYFPKFNEPRDSEDIPSGSNTSCIHSYSSVSISTRNLSKLSRVRQKIKTSTYSTYIHNNTADVCWRLCLIRVLNVETRKACM